MILKNDVTISILVHNLFPFFFCGYKKDVSGIVVNVEHKKKKISSLTMEEAVIDPYSKTIKGTNPQNLIEKITRAKIFESEYWKEHCFALNAETLIDKAVQLKSYGGLYSGFKKPTPFLCLILKMLHIIPEKEIVFELIKNSDYRYVRILGAFYLRLIGNAKEIYTYLEPLYNDFRRVRKRTTFGFEVVHVDEVIEELLTSEFFCDIKLPHLQKRIVLETNASLLPRESLLLKELQMLSSLQQKEREEKDGEKKRKGRDPVERDTIGREQKRKEKKEEKKEKKRKKEEKKGDEEGEDDILAMNKMRESLGLKPLYPQKKK